MPTVGFSLHCHRPLRADSENRMPLLATMPTGLPKRRPKPVTKVGP